MNQYTGNLFIVSAPSGAGKSSLLQALRKLYPELKVAISHTTRTPRPNEINGIHYYFVDKFMFMQMVGNGEFLEHAQVFNNLYGTSETEVRQILSKRNDLILEIDWQGANQVRRKFPNAQSIFILPPSLTALYERLSKRAQDSQSVIAQRMKQAQQELAHYPEYDYLIVNDNFEIALNDLASIIIAQQLKIEKQSIKLTNMLQDLLATTI
jgi:guanylate kinase